MSNRIPFRRTRFAVLALLSTGTLFSACTGRFKDATVTRRYRLDIHGARPRGNRLPVDRKRQRRARRNVSLRWVTGILPADAGIPQISRTYATRANSL